MSSSPVALYPGRLIIASLSLLGPLSNIQLCAVRKSDPSSDGLKPHKAASTQVLAWESGTGK